MFTFTRNTSQHCLFLSGLFFSSLSQAAHFSISPEFELDVYATLDISARWNSNEQHDNKSLEFASGVLSDSIIGLYGQYALHEHSYLNANLESAIDLVEAEFIDKEHKINQAAWFGVGHDTLGNIRYGRQYTVGQAFIEALEIGSWQDLGIGALLRAADNYQVQKQWSWQSRQDTPLQIGLSYSHDMGLTTISEQKNPTLYSVAARYVIESVYIAASYEQLNRLMTLAEQSIHPKATQFGAKYTSAQQYQFSAALSRQENGFVGLNGNYNEQWDAMLGSEQFLNRGKLDAFYIATSAPLQNGEIQLQYSQAKATYQDISSPKHHAKVMSLGYIYPYSTELTFYSYFAHTRNYAPEELWMDERSTLSRFGIGVKYEF